MLRPDFYENYENTQVLHYSQLGAVMGAPRAWRALDGEDLSGIPISIRRDERGELCVNTVADTHILAIGATRCGKTQSFVIPYAKFLTMRKNKCSMVLTDPKLELSRALAPSLIKEGYKVIHLNFTDTDNSDRWNPLTKIYDKYQAYLDIDASVKAVECGGEFYYELYGKRYTELRELEFAVNAKKRNLLAKVQSEVETIGQILCESSNEKDQSWMNGARAIFKGIIYAMLEDSVPGGKNPLITRDNFSFDTLIKIFDRIGAGNRNSFARSYFGGRDRKTSLAYSEVAKYLFIKADVTRDGFVSTLATAMTKIKDGAIRDITCASTFEMSDFEDGGQPVAIFISMKDETKLYYDIISLFLTDLYTALIDMTRKNGNMPRKNPFYFILDEFGNMPEFRDFDTVISSCGGRNIWFWIVIQSYAQLNNVYRERAEVVKDNLNMHIFLGTNNPETKQAFSTECGKRTIISPLSALNGEGETIEHFVREEVPAVPVSRLSKMEPGECVITRMNADVVWSRLERYYTCPEMVEDGEKYKYVSSFVAGDPRYEYATAELCADDDDDDDF